MIVDNKSQEKKERLGQERLVAESKERVDGLRSKMDDQKKIREGIGKKQSANGNHIASLKKKLADAKNRLSNLNNKLSELSYERSNLMQSQRKAKLNQLAADRGASDAECMKYNCERVSEVFAKSYGILSEHSNVIKEEDGGVNFGLAISEKSLELKVCIS